MKKSNIIICLVIAIVLVSLYIYFNNNHVEGITLSINSAGSGSANPIFNLTSEQRYNFHVKIMTGMAISHPLIFNFVANNPSITQTKIQDFLLAARLSLIAYQVDESNVIAGCSKLGLKYIGGAQNGDCYIWVAKLKNTTVIMIQGTEFVPTDRNLFQVWDDLSILPHYLPSNIPDKPSNMYVHYGLYRSLVLTWPKVNNLIDFDNPVWIVGHSLGAARSMLARYFIPQTTQVRITNLGGLRSANEDFWNHVSPNTVFERILFEQDFAGDWQPMLPYYHPTEYFYWLTNGTIHYVNQRNWLNLSFNDHSIVNSYIPALENLANV
jgi:hypothetical protein